MSGVGDGLVANRSSWSFGGDVALAFDSHVEKSVPLYEEGHQLICDLSDFFVKDSSTVYEVGTSTGTLALRLAKHHQNVTGLRIIGVDLEPPMIDQARQKAAIAEEDRVTFEVGDILDHLTEPADLVASYYTLQFIHPSQRQNVVDSIFATLNWGGAFFLFEKVRAPDARFQDLVTAAYVEHKVRQGYTDSEIAGKTRSLRGILEPFSTKGNLDMLKRAGFRDIMTVQKFLQFEGFLAIK